MKGLIIEELKKSILKVGINYDGIIEINRPKQKENGDYSSNIAMKLAGVIHENPLDIAKKLVENFSCSQVTNIEIKKTRLYKFFCSQRLFIR